MGENDAADENHPDWTFIKSVYTLPPLTVPRVTQTTPETSQTLSRHPTDTQNIEYFVQSEATGKKEIS